MTFKSCDEATSTAKVDNENFTWKYSHRLSHFLDFLSHFQLFSLKTGIYETFLSRSCYFLSLGWKMRLLGFIAMVRSAEENFIAENLCENIVIHPRQPFSVCAELQGGNSKKSVTCHRDMFRLRTTFSIHKVSSSSILLFSMQTERRVSSIISSLCIKV